MYRAFFSVPTSVTGSDGRPSNALHGYLDMVARLISSRRPARCVHVYDEDWRPAARVDAFAGYKADRKVDPDGLPGQFVWLRSILDALGAPQADAPGWEAEDAIGALSAAGKPTDRFDIVTGDRDLIQLVRDPQVRVLFTVRGVSELRVLDEAGVARHYGVPAARYADFAILRGDPSDGLPGVRGVGEKTARILVQAYPDLDALVADAAAEHRTGAPLQRSPALRAAIRDATPYIRTMREVVSITGTVRIRTWEPAGDDALLDELAEQHRVQGPIRRLREAMAG